MIDPNVVTVFLCVLGGAGLLLGMSSLIYVKKLILVSRRRALGCEQILAASEWEVDDESASDLQSELIGRQRLLLGAGEIAAAESLQPVILLLGSRRSHDDRSKSWGTI